MKGAKAPESEGLTLREFKEHFMRVSKDRYWEDPSVIATMTRPVDKFSPAPGPELGSGKYLTPEARAGTGAGVETFYKPGPEPGPGCRKHRDTGLGPGFRIFQVFK